MIDILLVDDQKTARESIRAKLESETDLKIVGLANDGESAIEQIELLHPDIVLLDIEMPNLDGIATTKIICQNFVGVKVIILSMHDDDQYVAQSIQAGAMGYLLKSTSAPDLREAIKFVYRGYTQIGPGLVSKLLTTNQTSKVATPINQPPITLQSTQDEEQNPSKHFFNVASVGSRPKKKQSYLLIWLIGNILLWSISLLYLKFKTPTYISSWKLALPGASSSTSINLPEIGQASSSSESPYYNQTSDPRENYKLLASSDQIIEPAARQLNLTAQKFGKPKVKIIDNTTLMELAVEGKTPQEAQKKALALQIVFESELNRLREAEVKQQDQNLVVVLKDAEIKLQQARKNLSDYQASSGLNSEQQLQDLSNNIEQLRKEKAQLASQQQKTQGSLNQLLRELGLSVAQANHMLLLQSDKLFQQYLDNYSQISTELVNLEAKYLSSHPSVINKKEEQTQAENSLIQRAQFVVGQSISFATIQQLYLNNSDGYESKRSDLLRELIALKTETEGIQAQNRELNQQITQLETKLISSSQQSSKLENLRRNLQIAEAVYSSILTKLELSKSNASSTYPIISLLTQPSLPREPSAPKTKLVLLGSAMGSFFLTTALLSLWWRDRYFDSSLSWENNLSSNHHHSLSNFDNIIQAIIKK
ncbi:hypothetical protein STA3757_38440 [Stanieria sp. NIES-3757]|nr:hypothetical protein STA3757_38440 [Stanieria sp. NIES-3757]